MSVLHGRSRLLSTPLLSVLLAVATLGAPTASAVAGHPQTPQAPVPLFTENFENGQGTQQDQLPAYTGPAPLNETYSVDPVWLSNCSGWISSLAEGPNDPPGSICDNVYASQGEPAAAALGTWAGNDPNTNHAVVSLTSQNAPYANKAELRTNTPIPVPANHYLTTSIDAADVGCGGVPTELDLLLLNGSTAIDTTPNLIEPCLHPQGNVNGIPVGTYVGNGATLFSGSAAGIEVVSRQNGANGNDGGFDNLKILDVTPQLDMGFVTSPVPQRASVTLVYTITNSSELDAKNGWSFTNTLPAGLVADPASATTNCGSVSATAGAVTTRSLP